MREREIEWNKEAADEKKRITRTMENNDARQQLSREQNLSEKAEVLLNKRMRNVRIQAIWKFPFFADSFFFVLYSEYTRCVCALFFISFHSLIFCPWFEEVRHLSWSLYVFFFLVILLLRFSLICFVDRCFCSYCCCCWCWPQNNTIVYCSRISHD